MTGLVHRLSLLILIVLALVLAACGTVATPEWAANVQETKVAAAATSEHLTAIAPTATPTITPSPTPSPVPATATSTPSPVPPSATPLPSATPAPAAEAATAEATAESSGAAAGSSDDAIAAALAAGNPDNGKVIFNTPHTMPDGASIGMCATCHSVTPDEQRLIGPGLYNVSIRAATRVEGQNAVEYIHNSIINPQAFIVPIKEGEPAWALQMSQGFGEVLSAQDINDVIAYLLTLHD